MKERRKHLQNERRTKSPAAGLKLASLVKTIDDNPSPTHVDITPSVMELIHSGLEGADAVLELLNSKKYETRLRAARVLEGGLGVHLGWKVGQGFPSRKVEQEFSELLEKNGNYSADAPEEKRKDAIHKWRKWLSGKQENQ